ncbi:phenylpropionate dioxygenase-like ring-hydroxylating dioxygenase large terminal subunit [Pseudoduganella lurida]|uniref:Phenylpropionate dioxygenase-like ring-hydroxylating dioxygenase large terminal subunit n=2 Tax=Pseudoduganella lurida TaxID=1036180 RepID=A0A562RC10_9BURK|nr:phenylpropionate dioxygenase-like ring-hydroxylating dioxygenase large terminal subunit [Pseudoduganella lurida]
MGFPDQAFFDALNTSALAVEQANTLPPLCYTDAAFYEFEKEAVFNHEWLCVGRASWVAKPGDFFSTEIIGEPLLIARNAKNEIKAMSAVCQHRAMLVAEGAGNARAFLCPYHHWTYSLDGELIGAPAMEKTEGFDKKDFCLPTLQVELWQGFIFVNFDPLAPPLAPRLAAIDKVVANYRMDIAEGPRPEPGTRYDWNWKVMFENNNDGYHANKLHMGPLHDFVPSALASFPDDLPDDTAGYYRFNGTTHPDAAFNVTQKTVFPIFPALTEEERNRMLFVNLPPTLSLVINADMILFMILRADSAETHIMDQGVLMAPGAMKDKMYYKRLEMTLNSVSEIVAQDLHVDKQVQVGLRSRYAVRGRYSWQEQAQQSFNHWLVQRYLAAHGQRTATLRSIPITAVA